LNKILCGNGAAGLLDEFNELAALRIVHCGAGEECMRNIAYNGLVGGAGDGMYAKFRIQ